MSDKDFEIGDLVRWLQSHFGTALVVVDHWDADRRALGLALESDPKRLVYIAAIDPPNTYFVELETAPTPGSELPYAAVGRFDAVDRERLRTILDDHLNRRLFDESGSPVQRFPCPCCGHYTLDEQPPGTYTICEICSWEDDPVQFNDEHYTGGANAESLHQARDSFRGSERHSRVGMPTKSADGAE